GRAFDRSQELAKFVHLAVGERIHGIDHDGPCAWRFAGAARPDRGIYYGNEEAQRLARAGASGHHKALTGFGLDYGLALVPAQLQRRVGRAGGRLKVTEIGGASRVERSIANEVQ